MTENETATLIIKLYVVKSWERELWSDFCTVASVVAIFWFGWFFESSAMQWFGFVCSFLIMFGRASALTKKMTPQETADFLKEKYNITATIKAQKP